MMSALSGPGWRCTTDSHDRSRALRGANRLLGGGIKMPPECSRANFGLFPLIFLIKMQAMKTDAAYSGAELPKAKQPSDDSQTRLIEGSPDCFNVLDLHGRLLSMNAGGMKALEISDLEPVIGSFWLEFWHGADREAACAAIEVARQGGVGRFI